MAYTREDIQRLLPRAQKSLVDQINAHNTIHKIDKDEFEQGRISQEEFQKRGYSQPRESISRDEVKQWFVDFAGREGIPSQQAKPQPVQDAEPENSFQYIAGQTARAASAFVPDFAGGQQLKEFGERQIIESSGAQPQPSEIRDTSEGDVGDIVQDYLGNLPNQITAPAERAALAVGDLVGLNLSDTKAAQDRAQLQASKRRADSFAGQAADVVLGMATRLPTYALTGTAGIGLDVGSEGYLQAREEGHNRQTAMINGVAKGGLAYVLNRGLGTLEKTIGRSATGIGAATVAEGIEEGGQQLGDPLIDNMTKGTPIPAEYWSNAAKAAGWGMFGGGAMRGVVNKAQTGSFVPNEEIELAKREYALAFEALTKDPASVDLQGITGDGPQTREALALAATFRKVYGKSKDMKVNLRSGAGPAKGAANVRGNVVDIFVDENTGVEDMLETMVHEDGHLVIEELLGPAAFEQMKRDIDQETPERIEYIRTEMRSLGLPFDPDIAAEELIVQRLSDSVLKNDAKWKIMKSRIANKLSGLVGKKIPGHEVDIKIREAALKYRQAKEFTSTADRAKGFEQALQRQAGTVLGSDGQTSFVGEDGATVRMAANEFLYNDTVGRITDDKRKEARRFEFDQRAARQEIPGDGQTGFVSPTGEVARFPDQVGLGGSAVGNVVDQARGEQRRGAAQQQLDQTIPPGPQTGFDTQTDAQAMFTQQEFDEGFDTFQRQQAVREQRDAQADQAFRDEFERVREDLPAPAEPAPAPVQAIGPIDGRSDSGDVVAAKVTKAKKKGSKDKLNQFEDQSRVVVDHLDGLSQKQLVGVLNQTYKMAKRSTRVKSLKKSGSEGAKAQIRAIWQELGIRTIPSRLKNNYDSKDGLRRDATSQMRELGFGASNENSVTAYRDNVQGLAEQLYQSDNIGKILGNIAARRLELAEMVGDGTSLDGIMRGEATLESLEDIAPGAIEYLYDRRVAKIDLASEQSERATQQKAGQYVGKEEQAQQDAQFQKDIKAGLYTGFEDDFTGEPFIGPTKDGVPSGTIAFPATEYEGRRKAWDEAQERFKGEQQRFRLKSLSEMNPKLFGKLKADPTFLEVMGDQGVKTAVKKQMKDMTMRWLDRRAALYFNNMKDGYRETRMLADIPERMLGFLYQGLTNFDPKQDFLEVQEQGANGFFKDFVEVAGEDLNNFFEWKVAQRAKTLGGKAGAVDANAIADIDRKHASKAGLFNELNKTFVKYNQNFIRKMVDSELISPAEAARLDASNWIPFNKISEAGEGVPIINTDPAVITNNLKKMAGSDKLIDENMFSNVYENWAYMYRASRMNIANRTAIKEMQTAGDLYATEISKNATKGKGNVVGFTEMQDVTVRNPDGSEYVEKDAITRYFEVHDDSMYASLVTADPATQKWLKALSLPSAALRFGTTHSAGFVLSNFLRDSMTTWALTDEMIPMWTALRGASEILRGTDTYFRAKQNGATFMSYDAKASAEQLSKTVDKIAAGDTGGRITLNPFKTAPWKLWQRVIEISENANRVGLFKAREGKVGSRQAAFEARDLLDFSGRGSGEALNVIAKLLPFFNSRLQGNYKIYRAIADNPGMVTAKVGTLAMATAAYAALNAGDDRYDDLPPEDKLNYWHFWIGDAHMRLPKPFEIGYIATLGEIVTDAFYNETIGKKESAWNAWKGLQNSLSVSPLPQFMKPIAESVANYNFFTGRNIEGPFEQGEAAFTRYDQNTSSVGRLASQGLDRVGIGFSGKKVDHLMRGYFGTMAMQMMGLADLMIDSYSDLPGKMGGGLVERGTDWAMGVSGASRFNVSEMNERNRRLTDAYDAISSHGQVLKSYATAAKQGNVAELKYISEQYPHVIRNSNINKAYHKALQEKTQRIKQMILTDFPREAKEKLIIRLRNERVQIAKNYKTVMDRMEKAQQNIP